MTDRSPVAVAWSTDGVTLGYRSPLALGLRLGDYVAVHVDGRAEPWLAQLLTQRSVERDGRVWVEGSGRLLGPDAGEGPFDRSAMTAAVPELVRHLLQRGGSGIELGSLQRVPELPAVIDVRGFNRHTFLCGQSGSGKTYALGGLLEQLLLATRLPLLVLDPNADHVGLGRTREGVEADVATRYATAAADVRTLHADPPDGADPLRVRFRELGVAGVAALLQLDPITDRQEYNGLVHALRAPRGKGFPSLEAALAAFHASGDDVLDRIRMRAENLGLDRMAAWAGPTGPSTRTIADVWQDRPRALVADTSGFEERRERIMVAVAVLEQLWAARHDRQPLLLVVDEAHDVCPADPADPLQRLAVDLFTRIAGEGRKYGIHLLLASQRPDKLPDNVLSQCDNLLLMRVNSAGDRASLASRFAFVPPELVELSATFGLGDMLRAGRISPDPQLARTGPRLTPEGGADVPTDWADPSGS